MTTAPSNPIEVLARMAVDQPFYRSRLNIEVSGEIVRYADVAADWQEADFLQMDGAWLYCVGASKVKPQKMRAFRTRPRGGSKTADLAIRFAWALKFSKRRLRLDWYSGDIDQAMLGVNAVETLCQANPWLGLEIQKRVVRNPQTGSVLEIMSSDSATNFGRLVDGIALDELANWAETPSAEKNWQAIASTLPKRDNLVCESITNSGRIDSFQWKIMEAIRQDPAWHVHELKVMPSWISQEAIAEQIRLLPKSVIERTIYNRWTAGTDTGVDPADVEACCVLPRPRADRRR